jgi:hypothetical protein
LKFALSQRSFLPKLSNRRPLTNRVAMISSFRERAKHRIAVAFCTLLVIGGVAPSPARASCGHDVTSSPIRSAWESLSDLELLKYSGADQANSAPTGPRQELPCSGPSCSRGRDLPPAPATSVAFGMSDPWCYTTNSSRWDDRDWAAMPVDLSILHPRHSTSRPERPPRNPQQLTFS